MKWWLVFFLPLLIPACYYDNEEELYGATNCTPQESYTYDADIQAITSTNCAISGCHTGVSPAGGLNLDSYGQVSAVANDGRLSTRVLVERSMPPSGPLSNCDQEAIQQWINAGAPQN